MGLASQSEESRRGLSIRLYQQANGFILMV